MFKSFVEIQKLEEELQLPFWECVLVTECKESGEEKEVVFERMRHMYEMMVQADIEYEKDLYSRSGLVGGDGNRIQEARIAGQLLCGDFIGRVMERAVKMGESNACMKRIVAAPTAGSCGVLASLMYHCYNFYILFHHYSKSINYSLLLLMCILSIYILLLMFLILHE